MPNVTVNGINCINPTSNDKIRKVLLQKGMNKINGFRNIGGREPGYGHFLLNRSDIDTFSTSEDISVVITDESFNPTVSITIDQLILVETHNLFPGSGNNVPVIATLADYRFIAKFMSRRHDIDPVPVHAKYGDPHGSKFTYPNIIKSYWQLSNLNTLYPASNLTYESDWPSVLIRDVHTPNSSSAWNQLNDILDLLSHKVYKINGGFKIIKNSYTNPNNTTLLTNNSTRTILNRNDASSLFSKLPNKVKVRYRSMDGDFWNQSLSFQKSYAGGLTALSNSIEDVAAYNIFDPCHRDADDYKSDLETLANKIADNYFDSYDNHNIHNAVYFGVLNIEPSPDCCDIEYYHDVKDNKYKTKIKSIDINEHTFPCINREVEAFYNFLDEVNNECSSGSGSGSGSDSGSGLEDNCWWFLVSAGTTDDGCTQIYKRRRVCFPPNVSVGPEETFYVDVSCCCSGSGSGTWSGSGDPEDPVACECTGSPTESDDDGGNTQGFDFTMYPSFLCKDNTYAVSFYDPGGAMADVKITGEFTGADVTVTNNGGGTVSNPTTSSFSIDFGASTERTITIGFSLADDGSMDCLIGELVGGIFVSDGRRVLTYPENP